MLARRSGWAESPDALNRSEIHWGPEDNPMMIGEVGGPDPILVFEEGGRRWYRRPSDDWTEKRPRARQAALAMTDQRSLF